MTEAQILRKSLERILGMSRTVSHYVNADYIVGWVKAEAERALKEASEVKS